MTERQEQEMTLKVMQTTDEILRRIAGDESKTQEQKELAARAVLNMEKFILNPEPQEEILPL